METIKDLITKEAIEKKYFFTFKDENELKRIFSILHFAGLKWNNGSALNENRYFLETINLGAFNIENDGDLLCSSDKFYFSNDFINKDIFDLFKELGLTITQRIEDFNIDDVDCLSVIKTKNKKNVRILAKDLKKEKPIVVAFQYDSGNEDVFTVDGYGKAATSSFDLIIEKEFLEKKCVEMTVSEIEKALGIKNLKIVK